MQAALAAALLLPALEAARAQTPAVIDACYVPVSGTIYRRNTTASPAPGAPANCLTPAHVAFQIQNGGGTIGPDLIYTGRIDMGGSANFGSSVIAKDAAIDPSLVPIGAGTRMMWIGQRAAFRAGAVTDGRWDFANLGLRSVGLGRDVRATSEDAIAIGNTAAATGVSSIAIGVATEATGQSSMALGSSTRATAISSTALGLFSTASADAAVAVGTQVGAAAVRGVAIGVRSAATTPESMVLGHRAIADDNGALVMSAFSESDITSSAANQVTIRGEGGIRLVPSATAATNCTVATDGVFSCTGGVKIGSSTVRVAGVQTAVANASTQGARATCPAGYVVTGGGVNTADGDMKVRESYPDTDEGWFARVRNDHPLNDGSMQVYALCLRK
ncbi:MAG: hypothetical protein MUF00_11350 [Gemmatimonadaceae bacterium]|jgi:hypothetical protein|nr:hypothetical protein [Gemmatimonadaceae bacterium]